MKPMGNACFKVYEDGDGNWRWRLVSSNGNDLANAERGYNSKKECIEDIKETMPTAPFLVEGGEKTRW